MSRRRNRKSRSSKKSTSRSSNRKSRSSKKVTIRRNSQRTVRAKSKETKKKQARIRAKKKALREQKKEKQARNRANRLSIKKYGKSIKQREKEARIRAKKKKLKNLKNKEKIDKIEELEDLLEDDFNVIEDDNISGKSWSPGKVEDHVATQWGKRFKNEKTFEPKRLKVGKISTPKRISKYSDKKTGEFDSQRYVSDVRSEMAKRAEKRGLRGDALNALKRKGPKMPKESKPKYGGAIENLKNKLGGINYRQQINRTTKKLTGDVKIKSREFQKVGLDIIKPRSSEDGAVPTAGLKGRGARKQRRRQRRQERRQKRLAAQTTTKLNDSTSTV